MGKLDATHIALIVVASVLAAVGIALGIYYGTRSSSTESATATPTPAARSSITARTDNVPHAIIRSSRRGRDSGEEGAVATSSSVARGPQRTSDADTETETVYFIDHREVDREPDPLQYELVAAHDMPPLERLASENAHIQTEHTTEPNAGRPDVVANGTHTTLSASGVSEVSATGDNERAEEPKRTPRRRRAKVYRRRERTGFYAPVHRFRMPFHSIMVWRQGTGRVLLFGDEGLPPRDEEAPYTYDSTTYDLIVPRVVTRTMPASAMRSTASEIACTLRYFEFCFELVNRMHTLRVNISHQGEYGDILSWNEDLDEYEWFDEDTQSFVGTRPDNPRRMVGVERFPRLLEMAKTYAVPVPISLLNTMDWRNLTASSNLSFELVPDGFVRFASTPPDHYDRAWVVQNVCFKSIGEAVTAIVEVLDDTGSGSDSSSRTGTG